MTFEIVLNLLLAVSLIGFLVTVCRWRLVLRIVAEQQKTLVKTVGIHHDGERL